MNMTNYPSLDETLQALADRQLDWEEEKPVRSYLQNDPQAQRRYEGIMNQNRLLRLWWKSLSGFHN